MKHRGTDLSNMHMQYIIHAMHSGTCCIQEAETGGLLWVHGQPQLQNVTLSEKIDTDTDTYTERRDIACVYNFSTQVTKQEAQEFEGSLGFLHSETLSPNEWTRWHRVKGLVSQTWQPEVNSWMPWWDRRRKSTPKKLISGLHMHVMSHVCTLGLSFLISTTIIILLKKKVNLWYHAGESAITQWCSS